MQMCVSIVKRMKNMKYHLTFLVVFLIFNCCLIYQGLLNNGYRLNIWPVKNDQNDQKILDEMHFVMTTTERRKQRIRIKNNLREMMQVINHYVNEMKKIIPENEKYRVTNFSENFEDIQTRTEYEFNEYVSLGKTMKEALASNLSNIIQKRLYELQNPTNCTSARKLICSLDTACGYGCQVHYIIYCLALAYTTKRTVFINTDIGMYPAGPWKNYFSTLDPGCNISHLRDIPIWDRDHEKHNVIYLDTNEATKGKRYRPDTERVYVPTEFNEQILRFHGRPFVWWIGQLCKYIFQYQPDVRAEINKKKELLKFQKPVVGVHVRRTDKLIWEAKKYDIDEYMYWVELFYKKLSYKQEVKEKRVFISTDDPSVINEIKSKYADYIVISDQSATAIAADTESKRNSISALRGIISDIELLSESDYLVCTFSSNVGRLAYEMMNAKHTNAYDLVKSLDAFYYFWGGGPEGLVKAIQPHIAKSASELSFQAGDIVALDILNGNFHNGEAKGTNTKTKKSGVFPLFKVGDPFESFANTYNFH